MKIVLLGAYGRMGKTVASIAEPSHTLIKIGSKDPPCFESCDVILDFSSPLALSFYLEKALLAQKPLVIGTTGHSKDNLHLIEKAAHSLPIFFSPNFSIGISLLKKLLPLLPKEPFYEIYETHHAQKKDQPSGTALDLAKKLPSYPEIHAFREGLVIGEHTIVAHFPYETVTIKHEALDRKAFAQGALEACLFLSNKPKGLYTSIYD